MSLINNLRCKGFGSNHNVTFEHFNSDYFLIFNPDILLTKTVALGCILERLAVSNISIANPIIVNAEGKLNTFTLAYTQFSKVLVR